MEEQLIVITGADSGMGREITRAVARQGFPILMLCRDKGRAEGVADAIRKESGDAKITVRQIDLASLTSVDKVSRQLMAEGVRIHALVNNAGLLTTDVRRTEDGIEPIVSVNYVAPYFLTRRLLPLMEAGSRIINTVSCTYAIGKLDDAFFEKGRNGRFMRIPVYANTKLALLLFTLELSDQLQSRGITVNATDPGVVSTNMIRMNEWFDPLTDLFYRPLVKTPAQGASTAIYLTLSKEMNGKSGGCYANSRRKKIPERILNHPMRSILFSDTEQLLHKKHFEI